MTGIERHVVRIVCVSLGAVLLGGVLAVGTVIWRGMAWEVGLDQMIPEEASSAEHESGGTFGTSRVYARSCVTREGLEAFARRNGYEFGPWVFDETALSGTQTHLFRGMAGDVRGRGGFLHCLAQDRRKRLENGAREGRLEFFYDIERQILYSLYWD